MTTTLAHFEHSTGHHICLTQKSVLKLTSIVQIGTEQLELLLSKEVYAQESQNSWTQLLFRINMKPPICAQQRSFTASSSVYEDHKYTYINTALLLLKHAGTKKQSLLFLSYCSCFSNHV